MQSIQQITLSEVLSEKHCLKEMPHQLLVFQTADKLIRAFAEQIFYTGFIHADPHPGNGRYVSVCMMLSWTILLIILHQCFCVCSTSETRSR